MMKPNRLFFRHFCGTSNQETKEWFEEDHARRRGDDHMGTTIGSHFNDIDFYHNLSKRSGCKCVELAAVNVVYDGRKLRGMNSIYRITYEDDSSEMLDSKGSYNHIHDRDYNASNIITFEKGEYLTGLVVQDHIDCLHVTLVTNKRRVQVGHRGRFRSTFMTNNPPGLKIVAFCGTRYSMDNVNTFRGIGFYMEAFRWKSRGTHILMRELVKSKRVQQAEDRPTSSSSADLLAITTQRLYNLGEEGLFRKIISYL